MPGVAEGISVLVFHDEYRARNNLNVPAGLNETKPESSIHNAIMLKPVFLMLPEEKHLLWDLHLKLIFLHFLFSGKSIQS